MSRGWGYVARQGIKYLHVTRGLWVARCLCSGIEATGTTKAQALSRLQRLLMQLTEVA